MQASQKPSINPSVVLRLVQESEAVLVNLDTGASLALNRTGLAVWQLVDGRRSVEQIAAAICLLFRNVPDTAPGEVSALLDALARDGFVGLEWTESAWAAESNTGSVP